MPRDEQHRADAMLRGLVGGGRSRLSLSAAMRARDVSRLTEEDIAWAEETVVLRHAYPAPPGGGAAAQERPPPPHEPPTAPLSRPGRRRVDGRAGSRARDGGENGPGRAPSRPSEDRNDGNDATGTGGDGRAARGGRAGRPRRVSSRQDGQSGGQDAGVDGDTSGSSPERS